MRPLLYLVVFFHFVLFSITVLAQSWEETMGSDNSFKLQFKEMAEKPLKDFKKKVGYDEAILNEKQDGLIVIDFRKIKPYPLATQWPAERPGDNFAFDRFNEPDRFYFDWMMTGDDLIAIITVNIYADYEGARKKFIRTAESVTTMELPWVPCNNKVGTVCAEDLFLFFVYKNVFVKVVSGSRLPNGNPFRDELAGWLFDILKRHPRTMVFPETLDETKAKLETKIPVPSSVPGGQLCSKAGWWFTPAKADSGRYFKEGELMPDFKTDYGQTIWQWLESQPEGK
jgi:hypothetical protein